MAEQKNQGPNETDVMLQHFRYEHLPDNLQAVSQPFAELAARVVASCPRNPERTVALRKLLEAKDCAVRSAIPEKPTSVDDLTRPRPAPL